ncbi:response regulator [Rhodopirellula sp. SWK7]|uniref:response regulator n=1 Tax=Rhodopirellula sp. SWK7 TaxID=595460 RepID=UPI0002BD79A1|nr:response regulator [Rhodopirellula sp. SWK7]EMI44676.1 Carbon storage regulator [Rhodopirellula sp. SWK7]
MLVLSRRAQQQISFPNLGVTLSILQVRGRIVKVGIEAPPEITVLRQETLGKSTGQPNAVEAFEDAHPGTASSFQNSTAAEDSPAARDDAEHWRRNQLNTLGLYLDVIQMNLDRGETEDAKSVLETLIANLSNHNRKLAPTLTNSAISHANDETPIHVLVVEDSDNERGLMTVLLAKYGFVVHVARDGAEAFEQLQQWAVLPDVILMDMQMPMFDGLQALQRIREDVRLRDVTVYAVTGSRRNQQDEPVGRGWDRWFAKPVDVEQLMHAITEDCAKTRASENRIAGQGVGACRFS